MKSKLVSLLAAGAAILLALASCTDPVTPATKAVTGVSLDQSTASIAVGATVQLSATVSPADATNTAVSWSTSDATKASVSSSGLVTGVAAGSATITVTTTDGSKTATCAVTVTSSGGGGGGGGTLIGNAYKALSAGSNFTVAIKSDGSLWFWGLSVYGARGDGTVAPSSMVSTPTRIGSGTDWATASAGSGHIIAIKTDGTLWSWGWNNNGQLGNGQTTDTNVPAQIGTDTTWKFVAASSGHNVAIKTDGSLWCWGRNDTNQLGDGTINESHVPLRIGSASDWSYVSVSGNHNLALKSDNSLWVWGWNAAGQLGDGTTANISSPTKLGSDTWKSVSAAGWFSAGVKSDGSLWTWGYNQYSQLGYAPAGGTQRTPGQVGSSTDWASVSLGATHSLAIKTDGSLWGWGNNDQGRSGNGTTTGPITSPAQSGTATNWAFIEAKGDSFALGVKSDGTIWSWGQGTYFSMKGILGDSTGERSSPGQIPTF